jgi:hypothetical protein
MNNHERASLVLAAIGQLGRWNSRVVADLTRKVSLYFSMSRNSCREPVCRIPINDMLGTFAYENASMGLNVPEEVGSFHWN